MELFDKHLEKNKKEAKAALVEVAASVIGKHVMAQQFLGALLSGGQRKGDGGPCLLCIINKTTAKMAKLDMQVDQIAKTYELVFGEEMDVTAITKEAVKEFYPLVYDKNPGGDSDESSRFSGIPEEMKELGNVIKDFLKNRGGKNVDVRVMDMSNMENSYGVDPNDYKGKGGLEAFVAAVKAAKKAHEKASKGEKGEKIIKEAVISKVEDEASTGTPKSSSPKSTDKTDKPN